MTNRNHNWCCLGLLEVTKTHLGSSLNIAQHPASIKVWQHEHIAQNAWRVKCYHVGETKTFSISLSSARRFVFSKPHNTIKLVTVRLINVSSALPFRFISTNVYYFMVLSTPSLAGDFYLNFFLGCVVEIPAYIVAMFIIKYAITMTS